MPRQLPAGVAHFAGRGAELAALDAVLDGGGGRSGPGVVISAIGGTAGVGKTALALQWAHQVAERFPDGQLYANLRGFDAGAGQPTDPADVLRGFLDAFGVHPERIPHDTESLAALYRSVLAGRKMLVLLDNAADVAQVRPLLPASPECLVIVTSRRELSALAAREGALLVQLDVLSAQEANELLVARLGGRARGGRAVGGDRAGDAVRAAAAGAVGHRRAGRRRAPAAARRAGGGADRARRAARRARRRRSGRERADRALAVLPAPAGGRGADVPAARAASGAGHQRRPRPRRWPGCRRRRRGSALRDLVRASLLNETVPGRYAFHDLLRAYAAEQAALSTTAAGVENTTRRMLDHYLHTAHQAHLVLYPGRELISLPARRRRRAPETFGGKASALAWLEAENQVLLKVVALAAAAGFDAHAWQLPVVLWTYHNVCGHWHDGARLHRCALAAAERRGDLSGQAYALRGLGSFAMSVGNFAEAHECLSAAQSAFAALGDDLGLARTDVILGQTLEYQGRFDEALSVIGSALSLSSGHASEDPNMALVRASALNGSAWNNVQLGELSTARANCLQAIELCRAIGYSPGEAGTWDTLGVVWQRLGDHASGRDVLPQRDHARPRDGKSGTTWRWSCSTWATPTR